MNFKSRMFHVEQTRIFFITCILLVSSFAFAQNGERIQKAMKPILDSGKLAGYVAIRGTADGITEWGWGGYADLKNKVPMQKDSLFWIASMSKPITASAVLMLVDEGKLSLDDPLDKFFPEFQKAYLLKNEKGNTVVQRIKKSPTIRQLLSHTAGLQFITPYMSKFGIDSLPPQRLAFTASVFPFIYEPGTDYKYSNTGIDIASAILEKVSGLSLEEFLQKRLFDPLEMNDTTFYPSKEQLTRLAKSYKWNKEKNLLEETNIKYLNEPYSDRAIRATEAGGGLFSTAEDSFHFHQMLAAKGVYKGKRILSENAIAEMTKVQTGFDNHKYGLGLSVSDNYFGHGGAHSTNGGVFKNEGKVVIFMIQFAGRGTNASEAANAFNSSEKK